jgi:hypothetical protein
MYSTHGEMRNAYKILIEKPEVKRPFGKPRCKWEDKTKTDLIEIWLKDVDWIYVTQDRVQL